MSGKLDTFRIGYCAVPVAAFTRVAAATLENPEISLAKYLDMLHTGKLFGDKLWLLYDLTTLAMGFFCRRGPLY